MITLESVGYRVRDRDILRGVDLHVSAGEVVAVIGPNGAGKSTLIAITAGDFAPSSGRVVFAGRALGSYTDPELALERAVLRQSTSLSFAFRVIDVVLMGSSARSAGRDTPIELARAERALDEVGLTPLRDRAYPTLSGGEKQRVHLARALTQIALGDEGKALLLDEPTEALDPAHQHRVLSTARRVATRGLAVLTVLHDPNLAVQYADRIVVLANGSIAAEGPPREVVNEALFEAVFGVRAHVTPAPWDASVPIVSIVGAATGASELDR